MLVGVWQRVRLIGHPPFPGHDDLAFPFDAVPPASQQTTDARRRLHSLEEAGTRARLDFSAASARSLALGHAHFVVFMILTFRRAECRLPKHRLLNVRDEPRRARSLDLSEDDTCAAGSIARLCRPFRLGLLLGDLEEQPQGSVHRRRIRERLDDDPVA